MKYFNFSFVLIVMLFLGTACSGVKDIRMTSVNVKSLDINGFRGVTAGIALGIHNPSGRDLSITDIEGTVYLDGQVLGNFSADTLIVRRKTSDIHDLEVKASFDRSADTGKIFSSFLFSGFDPDDCTCDISFKINKPGKENGRRFALKGIELSSFLKAAMSRR